MAKFKVGDKVIGNKLAEDRYTVTKTGWRGVVTSVDGDSFHAQATPCGANFGLEYKYFDLAPADSKVLITTDGKTTLARLYEGEKVTKSAEAKCAPSDTPDFATGATLAFDRLMGREAEKIPESKHQYKAGDKVKIIGNAHPITHFAPVGSVQKVIAVHSFGVDVEHQGQTVSFADIEPYAEPQEKGAFDWDAFKAGKVAVECKTEESKNLFLRDCEKQLPDLRWHSGDKPTSRDYPAPLVFQCKDGTMGRGAYGGVQPIDYAIPETPAKTEPTAPVKLYCVKDYQSTKRGDICTFDPSYGAVKRPDGQSWGNNQPRSYEEWVEANSDRAEYLYPLVSRPAKVGEWVYIVKDYDGVNVGDVRLVVEAPDLKTGRVYVRAKAKTTYTGTVGGFVTLLDMGREYLVLDSYDGRYEQKDEPTFTVTREQIASLGACSGGLAWFDKRHSDGKADFGKLVKEAEEDGRSGDAAWLRNREAKLKEAPKGWNGKVVCVERAIAVCKFWTIGKVYEFKNGFTICDNGTRSPESSGPIESFQDLTSRYAAAGKFIEYKGEARHE